MKKLNGIQIVSSTQKLSYRHKNGDRRWTTSSSWRSKQKRKVKRSCLPFHFEKRNLSNLHKQFPNRSYKNDTFRLNPKFYDKSYTCQDNYHHRTLLFVSLEKGQKLKQRTRLGNQVVIRLLPLLTWLSWKTTSQLDHHLQQTRKMKCCYPDQHEITS